MMDDISTLARFHEEITGDDPAALARVRARLEHAIGRPAGGRGLAGRFRGVLPTGRARLAAAVAVVAVVAGGAVVVDALTVDERPIGATAEAASLLNRAADNAIGAADPVVGPDEYLHVTTIWVCPCLPEPGLLETYTEEVFVPGDPANEWVMRRSPRASYQPASPERFLPADAVPGTFQADPAPDAGFIVRGRDGTFPDSDPRGPYWSNPSDEFLANLPRDPGQLRDRVYQDSEGHSRGTETQALVIISDLLRTGYVPADLRAALFRAIALIPGVEVTDDSVTPDGRTGVAVGLCEVMGPEGYGEEIIFDPDTGLVIGMRGIACGNGGLWREVYMMTTDVVPEAEVDVLEERG